MPRTMHRKATTLHWTCSELIQVRRLLYYALNASKPDAFTERVFRRPAADLDAAIRERCR